MKTYWRDEKERGNAIALKIIYWATRLVPRGFVRLLLYPITFYFLLTSRNVRKASRQYLAHLPNQKTTYWQIAKHIYYFSVTTLDRVYFLRKEFHHFKITINNIALINRFLQNPQGFILLGAHIGSFDVLQYIGTQQNHHKTIKMVMQTSHNLRILKIFNQLNSTVANAIIDAGDYNIALKIKEFINQGAVVSILGDRPLEGQQQASCKFLGDDINLSTSTIRLAIALKAPIIMFSGIYLTGNQYQINFKQLSYSLDSGKPLKHVVNSCLQAYADYMSHMVKKHPYNWFNFFNYWENQK